MIGMRKSTGVRAKGRPKATKASATRDRKGWTRRPRHRNYEIHTWVKAGRYPNCQQLARVKIHFNAPAALVEEHQGSHRPEERIEQLGGNHQTDVTESLALGPHSDLMPCPPGAHSTHRRLRLTAGRVEHIPNELAQKSAAFAMAGGMDCRSFVFLK